VHTGSSARRRADNKQKQTTIFPGRAFPMPRGRGGERRRFRVWRKNASCYNGRGDIKRARDKAREFYVPPSNRQWRRRPLCVGRVTPCGERARGGLLTYDRLLGHGLLRWPFRPSLADLFRHLVVKTTAARTMMLKMEKNYPNANSCLMFTFSVVVLHWRMAVGGGCWPAAPSRRYRPPPTTHDAVRT